MDSLYLFQFACLNFMVINALVIGITHYYARWRNRRYEQSRWMLFAAFTILAVQYFVQMRYGFRAAGDYKGAAVNLLFYAPSFTFIAMSIYNLEATHSRRKPLYGFYGITNAAIFTIFGFHYYLGHSLPQGRWLYVIEVLYVSMVFYSSYLIRIEMQKRKEILNTMVATDLMPYIRYAHTSFIYLFIASVIIPFAILYTPALYVVGPMILATLLFLTISFVMLGAAYVPTEELLTEEDKIGGVKRRKMMMKRRKEIKRMKQIMMKQMRIERRRSSTGAGSRFSQASTSGVTTMDTRIPR